MELHEHRRSLGKHPASCVHSPSWSWVTATSSPIPSFPRWPQPGWLHFFLSPAKCYKGYFLQRSKHWRPEISSGFFIPSLVTATSLSVEVIMCYIVDAEHIDMSCIPKSLIWRHKRRASLSLNSLFHDKVTQLWKHSIWLYQDFALTDVPQIDCDVKAGKIINPEFIAKCPPGCQDVKYRVYGTDIYASFSSVCSAAIHR